MKHRYSKNGEVSCPILPDTRIEEVSAINIEILASSGQVLSTMFRHLS
ncbi:hypothetical protein A2U01_0113999, partial [Trifolium medium]|nr:hypothetical protein [Trifolium medium]